MSTYFYCLMFAGTAIFTIITTHIMNAPLSAVNDLIHTIDTLRGPGGCPWDGKQSLISLKRYLLEETQELAEALESGDRQNICEELGDVLYLVMMLSRIGEEEQSFDFELVCCRINEKLIRRHPHVFETPQPLDDDALKKQWESIKKQEKAMQNR